MLSLPSVVQIGTSRADLYAFRITQEISRDDMKAWSSYLNTQFDHPGKIDLLIVFECVRGTETGASLSWDVLTSRVRAITNIDKYVVVGAPDAAQDMIAAFGKIIPVNAETFDSEEPAWRYLNATAKAA